MTTSKSNDRVLVIVAHADDETLGVGGAIARHVLNGDDVYAVSMTDGVGARTIHSLKEVETRAEAALKAATILGFKWIEGGNFPDNAMDTVPLLSVVKVIENIKQTVRPTLIYTHSSADLNIDHRIVSQATLTAFRPQPNETWTEIRAFEIPSATDYGHRSVTNIFCPNLYIDVTCTWEKKAEALNQYSMEMRPPPHSRSYVGLENLAKYRGNQVGVDYAEAFELIKRVIRCVSM